MSAATRVLGTLIGGLVWGFIFGLAAVIYVIGLPFSRR